MLKVIALLFLVLGCSQQVVMGEESLVNPVSSSVEVEDHASHLTASWVIDENFTPEEVETIINAGESWGLMTKGRVALTFSVGPVADEPWTIKRGHVDCCVALTTLDRQHITIDADDFVHDDCVGRLWHAAAHELGHTFFIDHGGDGLMHGEDGGRCDAAFTKSDVELFDEANK